MKSSNAIIIPYSSCGVYLVNIKNLRVHEEYIREHLNELKREILNDGILKKPIIVEKNTLIILDGTHRVTLAKELGFKWIPAVLIDYSEAEIRSWARVFRGKNAISVVMELVGNFVKCDGGKGRHEISIIRDGIEIGKCKIGANILETYWAIYFIEKHMRRIGCKVEIVSDEEAYLKSYNAVVIVPPPIDKNDVIEAVFQGKLFPPKSTRHVLKITLPDANIPLNELSKEY